MGVKGITHTELEFAFLGAQDHRLAFHAPDHVEGGLGLAPQGHLQGIFLNARLDGLAQLAGHFKEPVGWTEPFDALVRPLVVVIFDP